MIQGKAIEAEQMADLLVGHVRTKFGDLFAILLFLAWFKPKALSGVLMHSNLVMQKLAKQLHLESQVLNGTIKNAHVSLNFILIWRASYFNDDCYKTLFCTLSRDVVLMTFPRKMTYQNSSLSILFLLCVEVLLKLLYSYRDKSACEIFLVWTVQADLDLNIVTILITRFVN